MLLLIKIKIINTSFNLTISKQIMIIQKAVIANFMEVSSKQMVMLQHNHKFVMKHNH